MLDSSVYNKAVIDELITNLGHVVMVECFKIIYVCQYFIPKHIETEIIKEYCKITDQVYKERWDFIGHRWLVWVLNI